MSLQANAVAAAPRNFTPAQPVQRSRWLVFLAYVSIYVLWGTSYLGIAFASRSFPLFVMNGIRFTCAGLILLTIAYFSGGRKTTLKQWRNALIAGTMFFVGNNGLLVYAQTHGVSTGVAALIIATVPMFMFLARWMQGGAKPTPRAVLGLAIGLVGVGLLANLDGAGGTNPISALIVVGAGICWVAGSLFARSADLPEHQALSTGMQLFAAGMVNLVLGVLSGSFAAWDPSAISSESMIALVYNIIFPSVIGFTAYTWLLKFSEPSRVIAYAYFNPIVAVILGTLLLSEPLTPRTILAAVLIVGAVVLITRVSLPKRAAPPELSTG
jgi:drug/metabolite transporter (DMT)-like permease